MIIMPCASSFQILTQPISNLTTVGFICKQDKLTRIHRKEMNNLSLYITFCIFQWELVWYTLYRDLVAMSSRLFFWEMVSQSVHLVLYLVYSGLCCLSLLQTGASTLTGYVWTLNNMDLQKGPCIVN